MPESRRISDRAGRSRHLERDILYALTPVASHRRRLRSVAELATELEERDIKEQVEALWHVGLVHRTPEGRIYGSPAAVRFAELVGHIV